MATEVISTIRQGTNNSGLTRASNVVTVTLSVGTQLNPQAGDTVVVSGVTPASFNGTHTIASRISATQYTYAQTGSNESSSVHGSSGGDYSSPSSFEAGEQAARNDLVSRDEIATGVCYNDWPSGLNDNVTVAGWTTDTTRHVKITVAEGHRSNGVPQSGFFMKKSQNSGYMLRVDVNYTYIEHLDIENTGTADAYAVYITQRNCTLSSLISKTAQSTAYWLTHLNNVRNCLAWGGSVGFRNDYVSPSMLNCVAANCGTGFLAFSSGGILKNCVAYNNTTNYSPSGWDGSSTNNASSSASGAPGTNPVHSITSAAFADAASNDFHLSSGSVLRGAGVNLYSAFQTDIDGDTWPSSGAWDIGFDYYVAAGGSLTIDSITASNITSSGARITLGLTR